MSFSQFAATRVAEFMSSVETFTLTQSSVLGKTVLFSEVNNKLFCNLCDKAANQKPTHTLISLWRTFIGIIHYPSPTPAPTIAADCLTPPCFNSPWDPTFQKCPHFAARINILVLSMSQIHTHPHEERSKEQRLIHTLDARQ